MIDSGSDVNIKYQDDQTFLMLLLKTSPMKYGDIIPHILDVSRETLLDADIHGKTAYDYYIEKGYNILDEY